MTLMTFFVFLLVAKIAVVIDGLNVLLNQIDAVRAEIQVQKEAQNIDIPTDDTLVIGLELSHCRVIEHTGVHRNASIFALQQ